MFGGGKVVHFWFGIPMRESHDGIRYVRSGADREEEEGADESLIGFCEIENVWIGGVEISKRMIGVKWGGNTVAVM
jgi:hypothetical protein